MRERISPADNGSVWGRGGRAGRRKPRLPLCRLPSQADGGQTDQLPGAAAIFHEADFVGATRLSAVAPSETFEVQLGIDDRVKVERDLTARTAGKSAFIGNLKRVGWA